MDFSKISAALLLLSFLLPSCKKEKEGDITQKDIACFQENVLEETEIAKRLIGHWDWHYSTGGWTGEFSSELNKGLSFEFKSDGTLHEIRDGEEVRTTAWSLLPSGGGYFSLLTDPFIIETAGFILFCDDQLLFNGAALDANNNFFVRG